MLPPLIYALGLTVGLISYYIQQRSQPSLNAPYSPQPVKSFEQLPTFAYHNLIEQCTSRSYRQAAKSFKYDIIESAINEGDKRVLYRFPKLLKKQNKGKKLSVAEQNELQHYRNATVAYQPKTHEMWSLSDHWKNVQNQKEAPEEFPMPMPLSTGIINFFCSKVGFKFNHLQMTCYTPEKNSDFAFIQDTDMNAYNFVNREDRSAAIDERVEKIAAYGHQIKNTFYPEYMGYTKNCR